MADRDYLKPFGVRKPGCRCYALPVGQVSAPTTTENAKLRHLNVVFIGHYDAGKTTIGSQILTGAGQFCELPRKWQKEADPNAVKWIRGRIVKNEVRKPDSRGKFGNFRVEEVTTKKTTIHTWGRADEVGRADFQTERTRFTFLDPPGHEKYVPDMIIVASQADIGVLVISARKGEFETGFEKGGQTRELVHLAKTVGVTKLLVVVNKMDDPTVNWSIRRYKEIESQVTPFLKSSGCCGKQDIQFLPVSGLQDANLLTRMSKNVCSWWNGACLMEALDSLDLPPRDPKAPFRMPIIDKFYNFGTFVMGKAVSGSLSVGDTLMIIPNKAPVEALAIYPDKDIVESVIYPNKDKVACAESGENIWVRFGKADMEIKSGYVLCSLDRPIPVVDSFIAQLQFLDVLDNEIYAAGFQAVLHVHSVVEECEIVEMIKQFDSRTKKPMKKKVVFVKNEAVVLCRIQVKNPICIEKFSDFPQLGRFALRSSEGKTVAIGEVTELPSLSGSS